MVLFYEEMFLFLKSDVMKVFLQKSAMIVFFAIINSVVKLALRTTAFACSFICMSA